MDDQQRIVNKYMDAASLMTLKLCLRLVMTVEKPQAIEVLGKLIEETQKQIDDNETKETK
jgi:hypothetical protein